MKVTLSADMGRNEEIVYRRQAVKKANLPPFDCIGGNMKLKTKVEGFQDLYKVFKNMSKGASWMWWGLVNDRNYYTNESTLKAKDKAEEAKITRAYKELHEVGLIVRTMRQHYLINPKAMMPAFEEYDNVWSKWVELNPKEVL